MRGTHLNCLGLRGFLLIYLHGLVQFLLDHLGSRRWFDVLQSDWSWLFGSPLRVQSLTLLVVVTLGREGFSHIVVSLVFLVDEMVSGCDVVVPVGF